MKFLHCSDIHLSRDSGLKNYCLGVFDEILQIASEKQADFVLICGDLFNTFQDAEALRDEVKTRVQKLSFPVYYLPGNHEELERPRSAKLEAFDFGLTVLSGSPYQLLDLGDCEILAIAHQENYGTYREWNLPQKKKKRIIACHATVAGMFYTGPGEVNDAGTVDPGMFDDLHGDYAAMGHIHSASKQATPGGCMIAYPGSARVWRKSETGPRYVYITEDLNVPQPVELMSAGQNREFHVPAESWQSYIRTISCNANDILYFYLTGVLESDQQADEIEKQIKDEFHSRCRNTEFDREFLTIAGYLLENEIVAEFLKRLESALPSSGNADLSRQDQIRTVARNLVLREFKDRIGNS